MRLRSRLDNREARFSARVLRSYAATALPELLAVRAAEGEAATEILLYDEIGYWGITAKEFALALAQCGPGPVHVRINSPGGDSFDGLAIYNMLKMRAAPVSVTVDGLAASAASIIAMAGQTVSMPEQAMLMIHNCWGVCVGNRNDMTEFASIMQKIDGQMAEIYAKKCGMPVDEVAAAMDAETYYTSAEAKSVGLCDQILADGQGGAMALANARVIVRSTAPRASATRLVSAALPDYDPDGDGDNDAQEALTLLQAAQGLIDDAIDALSGEEQDEPAEGGDDAGVPVVPGARRRRAPQAAATEPEWVVGAAEDLPIDMNAGWDGPAAQEAMLGAAGYDGNSPDPAQAKRGFLVWDHHNSNLKGSFKLPFANIVDGKLTAIAAGVRAAASRLPQTDISQDAQGRARAVIDHYEQRMTDMEKQSRARQRRLRLAEAETV